MDEKKKYGFKNISYYLIQEGVLFTYEPLRHLISIEQNILTIEDLNKLNNYLKTLKTKDFEYLILFKFKELIIYCEDD
jgi:hypothetical protein